MSYPVSTSIHFRFDREYKVSLHDQIERIIRCGFTCLDFNFLDWNADLRSPFVGPDWERWIDDAGELAAKMGAKFNQAHAPVYNGLRFPGCTQEDIHEFQLRAIRSCAKLGIPWMVYHAIYTDDPNWMRINHEIFEPLLEEARKYGVGMAFITSLIRVITGLGTFLAFPGSMVGALCCGLMYKYTKKLTFTLIAEIIGTGVLGGLLAYPVAAFLMGKEAAILGYVLPFLISTVGGCIIAAILILALKKAGVLKYFE